MAHFSKDSSLIELLSKPHGDVFTMIAAKWTGKPEDSVDSNERDQTKRLVYGILYGMGVNTLAEQLHCSSGEAAEKIQSFKSSFPGVASWLHEAIASCRQKGWGYFLVFLLAHHYSQTRIKITQAMDWEFRNFLSFGYFPSFKLMTLKRQDLYLFNFLVIKQQLMFFHLSFTL